MKKRIALATALFALVLVVSFMAAVNARSLRLEYRRLNRMPAAGGLVREMQVGQHGWITAQTLVTDQEDGTLWIADAWTPGAGLDAVYTQRPQGTSNVWVRRVRDGYEVAIPGSAWGWLQERDLDLEYRRLGIWLGPVVAVRDAGR